MKEGEGHREDHFPWAQERLDRHLGVYRAQATGIAWDERFAPWSRLRCRAGDAVMTSNDARTPHPRNHVRISLVRLVNDRAGEVVVT
jgi:hypothetical protein